MQFLTCIKLGRTRRPRERSALSSYQHEPSGHKGLRTETGQGRFTPM